MGSRSSFTYSDTELEFNPFIFEPRNCIFDKGEYSFDKDILVDLKEGLKNQINPFLNLEEVSKDLEPLNELGIIVCCKYVEIIWMISIVIALISLFFIQSFLYFSFILLIITFSIKLVCIVIVLYQIDKHLKMLNILKYNFRGQKWYLDKFCKGSIGCKVEKQITFHV